MYELNQSQAANDLYNQLPLNVKVKNYSTNEKIFYPTNKLSTKDTPLADAKKGTLAYFAPWVNVVMFYGDFGKYSGLYEIGEIISGKDDIKDLIGTIEINKK
ncbi:cyclophilin-like fold protein [Fusobacterium polymorphum]|uniref:cyclophilin-like fold protein n=1 Tax=Fusobacterium nucleatum subsp. polymorphum TaxID=76857 RepID=UPI001EF0C03A|nr:hypothetical protein [Fusobacterium nucleatum]